MSNRKYLPYVVILNIVFLGMIYGGFSQILGQPKPMQYHMPYFQKIFSEKAPILTGYIGDKQVFLLLREGDSSRLYSIPKTAEFMDKLNSALRENRGLWAGLYINTYYEDGTAANFFMEDPQHNLYIPKEVRPEDSKDGVDNYQTR